VERVSRLANEVSDMTGTAELHEPATSSPPVAAFGYQPLWPFGNAAAAAEWQRAYREGGHQPWHLDPGLTALQFTQGYLRYSKIDRALGTKVVGDDAWVDVGFRLPNGEHSTAAVVHLAEIGVGDDAPWEVVGTEDSTLSLTTPVYGATVTSPMTVGGRITGVDENLRVTIWRLGGGKVGESGGVPAGGQNTPWSAAVAGVKRFAITGVRVGSS